MKSGAVIFGTLAAVGMVGVLLGRIDHLWFSVLPCSVICWAEWAEHRKDKRKKSHKPINNQ